MNYCWNFWKLIICILKLIIPMNTLDMRTGTLILECALLRLLWCSNVSNMSNCLSRVRGWWVRGQRRSRALRTSRALQMTDKRGVWSQRGGGSSHLTWPRETQRHRSGKTLRTLQWSYASARTLQSASPLTSPFCSFSRAAPTCFT